MTKSADRRQKVRVPVQSKIRHSQYQVLGTPVFQENTTLDLSSGGISFETAREYLKGNLVLLEVEMNAEPYKLLVCVAWVKKTKQPGVFQVGAELIAVDPVHKRKMQAALTKMIDQSKPAKKKKTSQKVTRKKDTRKKASVQKKKPQKKTKGKKKS